MEERKKVENVAVVQDENLLLLLRSKFMNLKDLDE